MDTRSYGCSRFLAVLLSIAAGFCLLTGLFTWLADWRLLRAQEYKQALVDQDVYARIPGEVGRLLITSVAAPSASADPGDLLNVALRKLTPDQVESIISALVTKSWLQAQVEPMLDELFPFLRSGGRGTLRMQVSFVEIKQSLRGETGMAVAVQVMHSLPDCTTDQLTQFAAVAAQVLSSNPAPIDLASLPACKPPESVMPLVTPALQYVLDQTSASIPEQVDLGEQAGPPITEVFRQPGMEFLPYLVWALRLAPLAGLFFLGAVTALVVRSLRSALRWWSMPVLFSGLTGLLTCLALYQLTAQLGAVLAKSSTGGVNVSGLVGLLGGVFQQVWTGYLLWAAGASALLLVLGGAGWLISLLVPDQSRPALT